MVKFRDGEWGHAENATFYSSVMFLIIRFKFVVSLMHYILLNNKMYFRDNFHAILYI